MISPQIWIVAPVFNDWDSAEKLVSNLNSLNLQQKMKIILVDDASTIYGDSFQSIANNEIDVRKTKVEILKLNRNLGNQGAIAIGLSEAARQANPVDVFVVMDSDGEDNPHEIPRMLERLTRSNIVVAKRIRRKKSIVLFTWHGIFKFVLRSLTGKQLDFGNFSTLGFVAANRILSESSIKTSFVGTVLNSQLEIVRVPIARADRYFGQSKTNKDGLFLWGFLVFSVFSEKIFVKLIRISVVFASLGFLAVFLIISLRLFTSQTIPGWSGIMITLIGCALFQVLVTLSGFVLIQNQIRLLNPGQNLEDNGQIS